MGLKFSVFSPKMHLTLVESKKIALIEFFDQNIFLESSASTFMLLQINLVLKCFDRIKCGSVIYAGEDCK